MLAFHVPPGASFPQQQFKAVPTPDLVLLDLNLPKKPGEQVLTEIKTDPKLRGLPIVVFSSGVDEATCGPLYRHFASTCIRKPISYDAFVATLKHICQYWFSIAVIAVRDGHCRADLDGVADDHTHSV